MLVLKKLIFLSLFIFCFSQSTKSQNFSKDLAKGDSLFEKENFQASAQIYQQLLQKDEVYSPQMLLKLARIGEISDNVVDQLYFLHLYYIHYPSSKVKDKIIQKADKHKLNGYSFDELEWLFFFYGKYYKWFVYALIGLTFLILASMVYQKVKQKNFGYNPIFFIFMAGLTFYIGNFEFKYEKAIVNKENSLLMAGPSAASNPLGFIGKGHRIDVLNREDIWVKVRWNDTDCWIKETDLKFLNVI